MIDRKLIAMLAMGFVMSTSTGMARADGLAGVVDWSMRAQLAFPVSGVIDAITVEAGQRVASGARLASLEASQAKAGVAEAGADLDRLLEEVADARRELDRVQELYARTVSTTTELDNARSRHTRAEAAWRAGQARLERARRLLAETELLAPFDAVVLTRLAQPGMVVSHPCQSTPVLTVARADEMIVRVGIDAARAATLRLGEAVEVVAAGRTRPGRIRALPVRPDGGYLLEVAVADAADMPLGGPAHVRVR